MYNFEIISIFLFRFLTNTKHFVKEIVQADFVYKTDSPISKQKPLSSRFIISLMEQIYKGDVRTETEMRGVMRPVS